MENDDDDETIDTLSSLYPTPALMIEQRVLLASRLMTLYRQLRRTFVRPDRAFTQWEMDSFRRNYPRWRDLVNHPIADALLEIQRDTGSINSQEAWGIVDHYIYAIFGLLRFNSDNNVERLRWIDHLRIILRFVADFWEVSDDSPINRLFEDIYELRQGSPAVPF